jgi:hypothetical protein
MEQIEARGGRALLFPRACAHARRSCDLPEAAQGLAVNALVGFRAVDLERRLSPQPAEWTASTAAA